VCKLDQDWLHFVSISHLVERPKNHNAIGSSIEPKKIDEALKDVDWVNAMHE
jgi:hypothetical protein